MISLSNELLRLDSVSVTYPGRSHPAVTEISFGLPEGEIACLLGPSGCGKTTLLRAIAGFVAVTHGRIYIAGREVASTQAQVPTELRKVGMVFQDFALFPHLNVADNISFGLRGLCASERQTRVNDMLGMVGLEHLARLPIHELSGGQQQRVALARALAPRPQLLLMDEPFSNLDVTLRERLAAEVRSLIKATGTTAVLVTHDQQEAFTMADRIAVIAEHRLQQWSTPLDVYHKPENRLVADFLGEGVWIRAAVLPGQQIATEFGTFALENTVNGSLGSSIELLIRPDDVLPDEFSHIRAKVVSKEFRGAHFLYTLALPSGQVVNSIVPSDQNHLSGDHIGIRLKVHPLVWFPVEY